MDNNELDKILKEKLNNTIQPPKELEDKIKDTIKEQKKIFRQGEERNTKSKVRFYKNMSKIISVAAVFIVIFTFGILYRNQEGKSIIPILPGANETKSKKVTIKTIEPTKLQSGIVAKDTEFVIQVVEDGLAVEDVQKSLYVEPALEYEISKTGSNEYKLKFKQNIPNNTILKLQYVKNQITEDSWAYQTSTDLSVNKTFPYSGATYVSEYTTIEVELSYANVENFEQNVTMEPSVKGEWTHLGKIWRFTPSSKLNEGTYTVTINKGISSDNKTMEKDYKFNFTVGQNTSDYFYHDELYVDDIETYSSDEQVRIFYRGESSKIAKVEISKFANVDEFIKYLNDEERNYQNATKLGEYEFENTETTYIEKFITLKNNLPVGYYVASMQNSNGKELFNCPIQINNLQAYIMETERDVIAWVAEDGKLASGVEVGYLGKTAKTNSDGIAKFEDITDGSSEIKYVKIGNDANKLVVGANNFTHDTYPNAYLYTDRPLYKSTDTINVWGFVPRSMFYDKIDDNEFYIGYEFNGEGKKKVKVEQDGTLQLKIELNNNENEYKSIYLFYKDEMIGSTGAEIKNYSLQNYQYEVTANKNYAYLGEDYEFDVKVTHITGIPVPEKAITVKYEGKTIRTKTDKSGIAHVSIKATYDGDTNYSGTRYTEIDIYNGDSEEYVDSIEYRELQVIARDVYINSKRDDQKINITLNKLLKDKNENIEKIDDLFDGAYDTDIDIYLVEHSRTRYISHYSYDEYTKQNVPQYNWISAENKEKIATVKTDNGKYTFDISSLDMKKDTDDVSYWYDLVFELKDTTGKTIEDDVYVYRNTDDIVGRVGYWDYYGGFNNRYNMYRYYLQSDSNNENKTEYSIGDKVNVVLKESTIEGEKEIKNEGKILRIIFKEDISRTDIIENDDFSFSYTKEDIPNINLTAAYFLNGKFYRMPVNRFDFKEEDRKVDIEITSDKAEYKPGDNVTLIVKTTNNGNPIKTQVNISVANEAVFEAIVENEYEYGLLSYIYLSKYYPSYTYSSYLDYIEQYGGGRRRRRRWR